MSRPLQLQEPQSFASLSVPRRGLRSPNCGVGRLDSVQRPEGRCRPANSAAVHRLVDCLGKISRSVDDAGVRQDAIHLILLSSQSRINQMGDKAALARPSFARCCSDPFVESSWNCDVLSHVSCHSPMIHTLARALHTAHACQPIFDRHRLFGTRGFISRLPLQFQLSSALRPESRGGRGVTDIANQPLGFLPMNVGRAAAPSPPATNKTRAGEPVPAPASSFISRQLGGRP